MSPKRKPTSTPGSYVDNQREITKLKESVERGEVVAIIGTGVSMSLTDGRVPSLSWVGLIRDGFAHGVTKGKITPTQAKAWEPQLDSSDIDDLLCAAEFVSRKLDAPQGTLYARWLEKVLKWLHYTGHTT